VRSPWRSRQASVGCSEQWRECGNQSWRATEPFFTPAVAFWLSLSMRARAAQPPKRSRDIILVEVVTTFSSFRFPELSQLIWNFSSLGSLRKAAYPMNPSAILHEVQQLYNVSDRLDSLAEQHPSPQKHSSPYREVFVTRQHSWRWSSRQKWGCSPGWIQRMPDLFITVSIWALGFRRRRG